MSDTNKETMSMTPLSTSGPKEKGHKIPSMKNSMLYGADSTILSLDPSLQNYFETQSSETLFLPRSIALHTSKLSSNSLINKDLSTESTASKKRANLGHCSLKRDKIKYDQMPNVDKYRSIDLFSLVKPLEYVQDIPHDDLTKDNSPKLGSHDCKTKHDQTLDKKDLNLGRLSVTESVKCGQNIPFVDLTSDNSPNLISKEVNENQKFNMKDNQLVMPVTDMSSQQNTLVFKEQVLVPCKQNGDSSSSEENKIKSGDHDSNISFTNRTDYNSLKSGSFNLKKAKIEPDQTTDDKKCLNIGLLSFEESIKCEQNILCVDLTSSNLPKLISEVKENQQFNTKSSVLTMAVSDTSSHENTLKFKGQVPVSCKQNEDSPSIEGNKVKSVGPGSTILYTNLTDDNSIERGYYNQKKSKTKQGHISDDKKCLNVDLVSIKASLQSDENISCTDLANNTLSNLLSKAKVDQPFNIKNNKLATAVTGASEKENSLMYMEAEQMLVSCEQNIVSNMSKSIKLNSVRHDPTVPYTDLTGDNSSKSGSCNSKRTKVKHDHIADKKIYLNVDMLPVDTVVERDQNIACMDVTKSNFPNIISDAKANQPFNIKNNQLTMSIASSQENCLILKEDEQVLVPCKQNVDSSTSEGKIKFVEHKPTISNTCVTDDNSLKSGSCNLRKTIVKHDQIPDENLNLSVDLLSSQKFLEDDQSITYTDLANCNLHNISEINVNKRSAAIENLQLNTKSHQLTPTVTDTSSLETALPNKNKQFLSSFKQNAESFKFKEPRVQSVEYDQTVSCIDLTDDILPDLISEVKENEPSTSSTENEKLQANIKDNLLIASITGMSSNKSNFIYKENIELPLSEGGKVQFVEQDQNILCIDLTDDIPPNIISEIKENPPSVGSKIISLQIHTKQNQLATTATNTSSKESNLIFSENKHGLVSYKQNLKSSIPEGDKVQSLRHNQNTPCVDLTNDNSPNLISEVKEIEPPESSKIESMSDIVEKEIIDPSVIEKNILEYFGCPPPPSSNLINSQSLNLLEEEESHLKNLHDIEYQFVDTLGDIVKLKIYPVSQIENKCYHRILEVTSLHKLSSKCSKTPDMKPNTVSPMEINLFQKPGITKEFKDKQPNNMSCSLNYMNHGITESKMVCFNSGLQINTEVSDVQTFDHCKINTHFDLKKNTSFSKSPLLSKACEQIMPTSSCVVNSNVDLNRNENFNVLQNVDDSGFNINVSVLRKILETAESLPSSTTNNESNVWKNKMVFDYNHTQSASSVEKDSEHNVEDTYDTTVTSTSEDRLKMVTSQDGFEHGCNDTSDLKEKAPEIPRQKSRRKKVINRISLENFDDFIGDEPIHYESDVLRNETSELKNRYETCQDESECEYLDNIYVDNDFVDYVSEVDSNEMSDLEEKAPEIPVYKCRRKKTLNCKRLENFDDFIGNETIHYESDVYRNTRSNLKEKYQSKEPKKTIYKSRRKIMEHKNLQNMDDDCADNESEVDMNKASYLKKKDLKIPQCKSRKRKIINRKILQNDDYIDSDSNIYLSDVDRSETTDFKKDEGEEKEFGISRFKRKKKMKHKSLENEEREVELNMKNIATSVTSKDRAIMICHDDSNHKNSNCEYIVTEPVYYDSDAGRIEASDFKKHEDEEKASEILQYKNREVGFNVENMTAHCSSSVASEDRTNMICQDDSNYENSDCEFIGTEPVHYICESGVDKSERSCLKGKDEDFEMPQYKSKRDKIMESKSLENEKEQNDYKDLKLQNAEGKMSKFLPTKKDKRKTKNNSKVDPKFEDLKKAFKLKQKMKGKEKIMKNSCNLFVSEPVKKSDEEKAKESCDKLDDSNQTFKHLYGNRVTNRGTFLTELEPDCLKTFKIPKKKKVEHPKEHETVPFEMFHSVVKSPNVNIESRYILPHNKIINKCYTYKSFKKKKKRSSWSSTHSFSSSRLSAKAKLKDKSSNVLNHHSTDFHSTQGNIQNRKATISQPPLSALPSNRSIPIRKFPLLNTPLYPREINLPNHLNNPFHPRDDNFPNSSMSSVPSHPRDDIFPNRSIPLLNMPSTLFHPRDNIFLNRSIPPLSTNSTSFHPRDDSWKQRYNPPLSNLHFSSSELSPTNTLSSGKQTQIKELIQSIISAQSNSSLISQKDSMCSFSENANSTTWNSNQLSGFNHVYEERPNFITSSDITRDSFSASTSTTDVPPTCLSSLNSVPRTPPFNVPFQNQFGPQGLNSFFTTSTNSSQSLPQTSIKAFSVCLVPQHLKSLVGYKYIKTPDVCLLILEWSVDWLVEQQKFQDPPPISTCLKKVRSLYHTLEDHYNTYFPLMLLETWHRIFSSWIDLNQQLPYNFDITSYSVTDTYVNVKCETLFNYHLNSRGVFPDEGSLLIIKYRTKSKNFNIEILGYVTSVKTRCFNPVTDTKFHDFKPPQDGNFKVLKIVKMSFIAAYHSEDIDQKLPIRVHVLCNVKPALKQNDALLKLNESCLHRNILNPIEDGFLSVVLTARNSSKEKVKKCVQDITEGILSPHPLPQLTIVKITPESDRLNIIPLLIENMKNVCNAKVLLCVRTVKALSEIAANICLHNSLKLVIINKKKDTGPQFRKYLLDELVNFEKKLLEENITVEDRNFRNEAVIREKRQILNDSDVIVSLIRNCHNEFMEKTFKESESIHEICCIVDEAHKCTEPETLIPLLHGISKLILIGNPAKPAKVISLTATSFGYSRSFFQRTYKT